MTDIELHDLMTYGACWYPGCGKPRHSTLERDDDGRATRLSLVCYAGHGADDYASELWWNGAEYIFTEDGWVLVRAKI